MFLKNTLKFYMPYRVHVSENFLSPMMEHVAVGVRLRPPLPRFDEEEGTYLDYRTNTPDLPGHCYRVELESEDEDGDEFVFRWMGIEGEDGLPVLITLEPLTLRVWRDMGERGVINGFERLSKQILTEAALQNSFLSSFLDEIWVEDTIQVLGSISQ